MCIYIYMYISMYVYIKQLHEQTCLFEVTHPGCKRNE